MTEAAFWWVNTVQVETYAGSGAYGDTWAAAVPVACWVEAGSKLVLNAQGVEVVSTAAVHAPLESASTFLLGSRVTTSPGAPTSRVITLDRFDSGSLALELDHLVVNLG